MCKLPWIALLFVAAAPVRAQFNSSIQGIVTDASAAVVTGASVRATNLATGVSRETATSADGLYRALSLGPGTYRITVEKAGFRPAERDSVSLGITETIRVDFVLAVGPVTEKVTVVDQPLLVETEQGRVSGRIERMQLNEMPLNGRNLYSLIALQPGVTGRGLSSIFGAGGSSNDSFAGELGPQVYASGQRYESNSYTLDDTSVNSAARGGITNLTPNADSVEEVRVVSNNFSAVDGRNSGAQIQVMSKSGGNQFHGGASYYFQNNTLASRNLFEARVPVFRRNQFGYNVGGPIVKNRTFFFHSYEGLRQSGARGGISTVETPEFRDFVIRTRPGTIAARLLRDFQPLVQASSNFRDLGSPRPGVTVNGPADGIADIGSAAFVPAAHRNGNQFSLRVDHELRPGKDRLYGNFYRTTSDSLAGGIRQAFDRPTDEYTHYASINHTHIFSANKINELRAGMMRLRGQPRTPPRLDIPQINVTGSTGYSTSSYPSGWFQTNFHYKNVFSWTHATHAWKMGAEARRVWSNSKNTTNFIPNYTFDSILDFADDEPLQVVRKVDPRTGDPATNVVGLRGVEWSLFFNDDWKVTHNFTLNLGLRYENYGSPAEVNGILRNLVFGSGSSYPERLAGARADIVPQFFPSDNGNWAPRFGFAWNPDGKGKTSVRGGYGIAYDRLFMTPLLDFRDNPPLRADATLGLRFGTPVLYSLGDPTKPWLGYPVDPALRLGLDQRNGIRGLRVSMRTVDGNLKTSYTHNFFFGLQRDLGHGVVAEVNYIGTAGHHLYNVANVHRYRGDLLDGRFDGFNPSFATLNMIESTSNSIYHGGTVQLRRAFRQGFTLQGAYTFGKTIDDADELVSVSSYQDIANRRLDRGLAGFDATHKLSLTGIWELPMLRGQTGFASRILGGWQLAGFAILQSGTPVNVFHGAAYPRGDFNADGVNADRPNAPADSVKRSGWNRQEFLTGIFRAADFPAPASGVNGNLGRNPYRGPGYAQVDLAASKKFAITERVSAQLRLEAFNALNRVNLGNPTVDLNSNNFGRVTSALTPRVFQGGLRVQF